MPCATATRPKSASKFRFPTRLCRSCDGHPGIRRERTNTGFRYRTADGRFVRDQVTLARIAALAIPPAWEDVWICPKPNGHLQATGRDSRGRKQYRYHPAFRSSQEGEKYSRLAAFGVTLRHIRDRVQSDLARHGLPREKVLAAVVALLDRTHLRVGNAEYVRANGSFGLSTLHDRHASFADGSLRLRFRGKSGIWHERRVDDPLLARVVRSCRDVPGQHLFQYRDETGRPHKIGSSDVNDYIREVAGGPFTAKDFRTWAGTVSALARLAELPKPESATAAKRTVAGVIGEVAAQLGNTPAVCRKSYVHPAILSAFVAGSLPVLRARGGLSADEAGVMRLLTKQTLATGPDRG
jgi:DNA topoisomerase-1